MSPVQAHTDDYNIAAALQYVAESYPHEDGLVVKAKGAYRRWTFKELRENSERYGAGLKREGIEPGQRVMLMVPPSMEFLCLTFALFKLGAVAILIDPGMGYRNLLRCIGNVQPEALIGIPKAQVFSRLFPRSFKTIRTRICVGRSLGLLGKPLKKLCRDIVNEQVVGPVVSRSDLAAIIFTTGSTGPPKGVQYTHGVFHAQLEIIKKYYRIKPGDVDQPAFPLFALFSIALGAKAVIPEMDPARPASVDPNKFIRTITDHQVTYSFGSPAIWNVVSRYCLENKIKLPVRKILMAGAPVPGDLIERVFQIMPEGSEIHIPYGATESLPISSMSGREILADTWRQTRRGRGACVGRPLPGIDIQIIRTVEGPLNNFDEAEVLPVGEIGEIVVKGAVVTRAYDHNDAENALAKIKDKDTIWHRIGDMGYFDDQGRLWFCGRKAHRVLTPESVMYTIPCEALFNEHPKVLRSALVGVGEPGEQQSVLIVELADGDVHSETLLNELCELARKNKMTENIKKFLVHPAFPVDIRHNAKIFREKLAVWTQDQIDDGG